MAEALSASASLSLGPNDIDSPDPRISNGMKQRYWCKQKRQAARSDALACHGVQIGQIALRGLRRHPVWV